MEHESNNSFVQLCSPGKSCCSSGVERKPISPFYTSFYRHNFFLISAFSLETSLTDISNKMWAKAKSVPLIGAGGFQCNIAYTLKIHYQAKLLSSNYKTWYFYWARSFYLTWYIYQKVRCDDRIRMQRKNCSFNWTLPLF